jgi:hypothetical protein
VLQWGSGAAFGRQGVRCIHLMETKRKLTVLSLSGCMHIICQAAAGNSVSGGVGSPGACLQVQGGFCLEKKTAACTCRSVIKDRQKTDL